MALTTVSSAYLSGALLPSVRQAQAQLANLEIETSTGQYANLGVQLGSESGYELSLRTQDDLIDSLTTANSVTAANMSSAQSALTSILSAAQSASQHLIESGSGFTAPSSQQSLGESNLQQLISLANTTSAGGYVFGGQNTEQAPLDDFFAQPTSNAKSALDAAFQSYFGFSVSSSQVAGVTGAQMQAFLAGPVAGQFESPAWGDNWSTASSTNVSAQISPGATIATSTNANGAGFQQLAQGYAALTEFGDIGLSSEAQQALASAASTSINLGVSSVIATQAQLGDAQNQVTQANAAMSDQKTFIQTEIARYDSVDPAQVSTELTTLSTQLETAYQLTSQIHNLNLAQYLPT